MTPHKVLQIVSFILSLIVFTMLLVALIKGDLFGVVLQTVLGSFIVMALSNAAWTMREIDRLLKKGNKK